MQAGQAASMNFILERMDGSRTPISLVLGVPYIVDAVEARCPVLLDGLDPKQSEISGGGTLQALCLAMRFAWLRLNSQLEAGHHILEAEDGAIYDRERLATLFGMGSI